MPETSESEARSQMDSIVAEVSRAVARNDTERAFQLADEAIRDGHVHPILFNARAIGYRAQERHPQALQDFRRALTFMPNNPVLLNAIGLTLTKMNRAIEGISAFDAAIAIDSNNATTHSRKGWALVAAGRPDEAVPSYERAISLQPNHADALAGLASIAARKSQRDEARNYAQRALAIDPTNATAIVALAMIDISAGQYEDAERRLRQLLDSDKADAHARGVALGFLGDALDGQEKYHEAFKAYEHRNLEFRRIHEPRFEGERRAVAFVTELDNNLKNSDAATWAARDFAPASMLFPREHVFLLGFIRSGTTLLEQVLATHPDVVHLEERETFPDLVPRFLTNRDDLEKLANLRGSDLAQARDLYWARVNSFGADYKGKVFIDKQPLNTFNLPLIAKLFPDAKILFAVRDPRDVVFSAYRRHFEVNPTTFEFLQLEDAGRFYDVVMRLADTCREKLPLDLHEHRYEEMVADFDETVRKVCNFLRIEWTDSMRDFGRKAQEREIRSPSAGQVRRGLYGDGVGQWRKYKSELAPLLPILAHWVNRFGYSLD